MDGGSNLAYFRRWLQDSAYRARRTTDDWRELAGARIDRIPAGRLQEGEEHREVMARLNRGELSWAQVMDVDSPDEGCRAFARWTERRLETIAEASWLARRGMAFGDAFEQVTRR